MKSRLFIPAAITLMGISGLAWADKPEPANPDDDGEVTISLMPAGADVPDVVTNRIALPTLDLSNEVANDKVKRAKAALEHAEQKRTEGRDHGWSHANAAREQAQDMADDAKANRENRGRSEDRPDPPNRPDDPGRPDNPGRP